MRTTYHIDPAHSVANFSIKHLMISKVHGAFRKISGTLIYDSVRPEDSIIDITIEANSLTTHEPQRDGHLKSGEFFDVLNHPTLTFKSSSITGVGKDFKVLGSLTLRGVTKPVTLLVDGPSSEIKDPWGNIKIGATATSKIKRKDFGMVWNTMLESGGVLVGDDVNITLDVEFLKHA